MRAIVRDRPSATARRRILHPRARGGRHKVPDQAPPPGLLIEGVATNDGVALVLHGDATPQVLPHLEALLASLLQFGPRELLVDLSQATSVSGDVLAAIRAHRAEVASLTVRLPDKDEGQSFQAPFAWHLPTLGADRSGDPEAAGLQKIAKSVNDRIWAGALFSGIV